MYFPETPFRRALSLLPSFILLLISHLFQTVNATESFEVIGPDQPVISIVGEDVVLPCHLSPALSDKHMQVRWFRTKFNSVVHLYKDGMDQNEYQIPEYRGRTELLRNHISNGSVSLRIHNITLYDEGSYTCFVRIDPYYEEATLELKVASLGSAPSISVIDYQDRGIRVLCESAGWYPEPEVTWRQEDGQNLTSLSETETQEHNSLFSVKTSLLMRTHQYGKISCSIRNIILNQERELVISITDAIYQRVSRWMVSLSILLLSVIILWSFLVVLVIYHLRKECQEKAKLSADNAKLSADIEWRKRCSYAVDVTLDPTTAHRWLFISEDRKRVTYDWKGKNLPDSPERFDIQHCVLGCEGFTSGRHYWEVEVSRFWGLGVCKDSMKRKGEIRLSPKEGVWAVGLGWSKYKAFTFPCKPLALREEPSAVGILLDYEAGKVSFYNADNGAHLFTFTDTFTETLRPFFYVQWKTLEIRLVKVPAWE